MDQGVQEHSDNKGMLGSFVEHYLTDNQYRHFPQEHRSGGTFGLTIVDVKQEPGEFGDPAVPEFAFVSNLHDCEVGEFDFGDGWFSHRNLKGCFNVQPPDTIVGFRIPAMHLRGVIVKEHMLRTYLEEIDCRASNFSSLVGTFSHLPRAAKYIDMLWLSASRNGNENLHDFD